MLKTHNKFSIRGYVFGAYQVRDLIKQINAPFVFLLNDLWMLKNYINPLRDCREQTKMIIYSPLDGKLSDDSLVALFENVDRFVVHTSFAQAEVARSVNVKLCLHHAVMNQAEREAILTVAQGFGILERLILSSSGDRDEPISGEKLNWIYNACDVGLNTAMGEGWGLVSFEHAATGAAQILPSSSAGADLWQGAAELLEPVAWGIPSDSLLEMAEVSIEAVARSLEKLYQSRNYRQTMSLAAYHNATQPQYHWTTIAQQWDELFRSTLENI